MIAISSKTVVVLRVVGEVGAADQPNAATRVVGEDIDETRAGNVTHVGHLYLLKETLR
jgi:hypothetical protein